MTIYKIFLTSYRGMSHNAIPNNWNADSEFDNYKEAVKEFYRVIDEIAECDDCVYLWENDKLIKVYNDGEV